MAEHKCCKCGTGCGLVRDGEEDLWCPHCLLVEVERLRQDLEDQREDNETMRSVVLADPDHDSDTINWALEMIDYYCKYPEAAEAAKGGDDVR